MNNNFFDSYNKKEPDYNQTIPVTDKNYLANYMSKVYGWMFLGLMITAVISLLISRSESFVNLILTNRILFFGIMIGQLFLVDYLAVRIQKMSALAATLIFLGYAAANGLVFSILDRKSTRLNSSHVRISYAVFCLK